MTGARPKLVGGGSPLTGKGPPAEPWQVIDSELVLDSPWMRVRRESVRTAAGFEIPEYYVIEAPDIVVMLALTEAGEAVLVEQYRHGTRTVTLELPAGLVDPDDSSPRATAERELREETGYRAGRLEFLGRLHPSPARQANATYCFLALDCRRVGEPGGDPSEGISLRLLPLSELRAAARRCELPSQVTVGCLFLGLERLRELGLA